MTHEQIPQAVTAWIACSAMMGIIELTVATLPWLATMLVFLGPVTTSLNYRYGCRACPGCCEAAHKSARWGLYRSLPLTPATAAGNFSSDGDGVPR